MNEQPTTPIVPADVSTARATFPPPSWRLMMSHPAHQLSFGFGSGLIRVAPGTWGTLFAWLVFDLLGPWISDPWWGVIIAVTAIAGAAAAQRTGAVLGRPDHGSIVIDEIVAFWLVLWLLPGSLAMQAFAFVVFRAFDIVKPPPIRAIDARFKNGAGVMADDLVAAFYTLLVAAIALRLTA
jgi:phosphatidylglycerophosphatase A